MSSRYSSSPLHGLKGMCTKFPVNGTRYLTAVFFLLGAIFFTINGFLYVFQTTQPQLLFRPLAVPITGCIGDFLFILGCTSAVFEALNTKAAKLNDIEATELDLEVGQEKHPKHNTE